MHFHSHLRLVLLMSAWACVWRPATGFESGEHCTLANLAARIALDYAATEPLTPARAAGLRNAHATFVPESSAACFPKSWTHPDDIPFSYGKVAALVDYVSNPQDLFLRYGRIVRFPQSPAELSDAYFAQGATGLLGRYSVASHNNIEHFQGLLLSSFKIWHEAAIESASQEDGLFEALTRSAIADHFLEDFFAPGHMITPRDGFPDIAALGWHDYYNNQGMPLTVRDWSSLEPLIRFIMKGSSGHTSQYDADFQSISHSNKRRYPAQTISLVDALELLHRADKPVCPKDSHQRHPAMPALATRADSSIANQHGSISILCIYGDGMLDGHEVVSAQSVPAEKALIVLVEARYILSVVDPKGTPSSGSFTVYQWCPRTTTTRAVDFPWRKKQPALSERPQAADCMHLAQLARDLCSQDDCPNIYNRRHLPLCSVESDSQPRKCAEVDASPYASIDVVTYALQPSSAFVVFDPVFSMSTSFRSGQSTASSGVGTLALEVLPIGIVGARDALRYADFGSAGLPTLGLSVGYEHSFVGGGSFRSAGTARLIWAIARLDTQFSLVGEWVRVSQLPVSFAGWGYGGRFEVGFSFLTVFVQATREPTASGGHESRGTVLRAGVSLAFSGRRAMDTLSNFARQL
jgi:hypothetical protein